MSNGMVSDSTQTSAVDSQLLRIGEVLESAVDAELERLEQTDELERIRQKRIRELKARAQEQVTWQAQGHGEYTELKSEKDFFGVAKASQNVVCHFFRDNRPCKILDEHLAVLARAHMETKFLKLNAENSPYLTEKLRIKVLPTLALLKAGKVVDYVVGFDDLGGQDTFSTEVLEARLIGAGVLETESELAHSRQAQSSSIRRGGV